MKYTIFLVVLATAISPSRQEDAEGESAQSGEIRCPFFKAAKPDTTSNDNFIYDLSVAGCDKNFCGPLARGAAILQRPLQAIFEGGVVDIFRLDEIPLVSHADLYNNYPKEVTQQINNAISDSSGMIYLQDLVNIKLWVAKQAGVESPNIFSRGEVVFLFLRSGGDLDTERVAAADVLTMLAGTFPNQKSRIGVINFLKGSWKADFSAVDGTRRQLR